MNGLLLIDAPQGSPEWLQARVGVITASRFRDAADRLADKVDKKTGEVTRGAPSSKAIQYAATVALERIAGAQVEDVFVNGAMRRGSELEPHARAAYETRTGHMVLEAGILLTPDRLFGYSTDGLVGDDGLIEIKCPASPARMVEVWRDRNVDEWLHQVQGGLWLTGRRWCDLIVYDPRLAAIGRDLFILRVQRDEAFIERLEADLVDFAARVAANEAALRDSPAPEVIQCAADELAITVIEGEIE